MDKKIIKGLIDEKLEVIQEQFSIIKAYEGKIPNIELDLFMTSIRDLYELVLSLQTENIGHIMPKVDESPAAGTRFASGIISMEPAVREERSEPEPESIPEPEPEPEPEPIPEPASEPIPEPETVTSQMSDRQPKLTVDLFSEMAGSTLADRLKDGNEKRIADKLQENKIPDLRTTIGINDKFLFINELFEGNMRIYDEAIQKLNAGTTIAQADLLLLDLKIAYNWDSNSPTVKKFVELVRRKF